MKKRFAAIALALACFMTTISCGSDDEDEASGKTGIPGAFMGETESEPDTDSTEQDTTEKTTTAVTTSQKARKTTTTTTTTATTTSTAATTNSPAYDEVLNFTPPEDGEEIIVLTIKDYGDIRIKLFPECADKGVENFKTLTGQGYYDGIIFHRIINNFMIQGGDPTGTGRGGSSIWGSKFDGGVDPRLIHVSGAVAYANSGSTSSNGSQFYIVTGQTFMESQFADSYPEVMKEAYLRAGGYPWLDGKYTVFGQVFDGLDIVYKLQSVATDSSDKPLTDVVIESARIEKYDGRAMKWYISDYS